MLHPAGAGYELSRGRRFPGEGHKLTDSDPGRRWPCPGHDGWTWGGQAEMGDTMRGWGWGSQVQGQGKACVWPGCSDVAQGLCWVLTHVLVGL